MMMMAYNNNKQLLRARARIEYTSGLCKTVVVVEDVSGGRDGWRRICMSLVLLNGLENYTYVYILYTRGKGKIKEGRKEERMRCGDSVRGGRKRETTISRNRSCTLPRG